MTSKLHISTDLSLPLEAVTQTFAILAKRGVGKSYTASVMAEEMLKAGQQIVAIDPTGGWWGLRSKFPIVVLGGEHADVPLEESAGEVIARAIVENRFPCVVDLSLFRKGQLIRFMVAFAETLYRLNREPLHAFIDEADAMAPQGRSFGGEENRMLGAMEDIVRRGRKRGIGCTLITQRPAVLNKNVLTQCESLFAMRLTHPRDIGAIREWIDVHADPAQAALLESELPSLPIGTAWFWSPGWLGVLKKIAVRKRETFDSSATPKPGQSPRQPKSLAAIDVAALGEQIKQTVAKAKADDPKELRKRIADLERQAKAKPTAAVDQASIDRAVATATAARDREWQAAIKQRESLIGDFKKRLTRIEELAHVNGEAVPGRIPQSPPIQRPVVMQVAPPLRTEVQKHSKPDAGDSALGRGGDYRMLVALAQNPDGINDAKLSLLTGLSKGSGTFGTYLGKLRSLGLIEGGRGCLQITPAGIAAVGDFDPLPTGAALIDYWRGRLGESGKRRMFEAILAAHPRSISKDEIAEQAEISPGSGTFGTYLGELRTLELITKRGEIRANDSLFD